ncbi:glycoside hydrolase family 31 protein [Fictibacillus fluitans]|uniref:Glycoside hydrolase family 31 protein n=1 Tax=Fictibacillus fluitans TaxID=3058422 RepID=A0ABT8HQG6_9BACL|nr:glycoside hydrolase family 31 protein [Fictibacillus sp. NE201]MDN4523017.1 glycoside hydrolase family 31 protein [Fictibacillus sp. NE201]
MSILTKQAFTFIKEESNILHFRSEQENIEVKIMVLEEDIIRVLFVTGDQLKVKNTWSVAPGMEDVPFDGIDRLNLSGFSKPAFSIKPSEDQYTVETKALKVVIGLEPFKLSWFYRDAEEWIPLANDRKTQAYHFELGLQGPAHYLNREHEEQYFGLGEKSGHVDKHGKRYRMQTIDAMGYDAEFTDPLYKHVPFYITRNQKTGLSFGIFYDNLANSIFEMGSELDNYHGYYRYYEAEKGDLDYYIIAGPQVKDVTRKFAWMTGKTILPPKWSLGYSGSTMSYTDAPDAQEQLNRFLQLCREHDILCDSFQLSSGYTSIEDKRYVFHWNDSKFPDPQKMAQDFHEQGVRLCANIKPCLLNDHPMFDELEKKEMFIKDKTTGKPEIAQFWDETGAYLDFTKQETYEWWKQQVKEKLMKYGIDSTWNDNNEFEIWSQSASCDGFGESLDFDVIRALQPLLMMKASYEAQKEFNPDTRPYLISRSGCVGMHRYVQTWTGDNRTSWKTIKFNNKMGIGLSLSGIYNFGHDVGGFSGPAPEPELFVRWVQNGIMHPRFTIHSWNDDETVNEPWMYPEVLPEIRKLIKFRTKIIPYLYTALYHAHASQVPMITPTFWDFEHDEKTFDDNDDFMLGESLLVASVVEKEQRERPVYLPKHQEGWYDLHTGEWYEGGQCVTIPAPLSYVPLLAKGGSIIPINQANVTFETKEKDERAFLLFPQKGSGFSSYRCYEDDGISNQYKDVYAFLTVETKVTEEQISVTVDKEGTYELPYNEVSFILPDQEHRKLTVNGVPYENGEVFKLKN